MLHVSVFDHGMDEVEEVVDQVTVTVSANDVEKACRIGLITVISDYSLRFEEQDSSNHMKILSFGVVSCEFERIAREY